MKTRDPDKYKTTAEASKYLKLAMATLNGWRSEGKGPPFYKFGHAVRYHQDELDQWAESQRCGSPK